jgi:hypothetical protein
MPPHFVLNFERGAELSAALRKEISEHHWEVAGAQAYPWLVAVDLVARPPTGEEVTIAEALALALPKVLKEKTALLAAWHGGETVSRTLSVHTHAGDIEVLLRVPYEQETADDKPPNDVLADLVGGVVPIPVELEVAVKPTPRGFSGRFTGETADEEHCQEDMPKRKTHVRGSGRGVDPLPLANDPS